MFNTVISQLRFKYTFSMRLLAHFVILNAAASFAHHAYFVLQIIWSMIRFFFAAGAGMTQKKNRFEVF